MHKSALVTLTMVTTALLHIFWCFVLVNIAKLGFIGVGLATLISYIFNFTMITLFCTAMTDLKESFFFFTRETFDNMGEYL